MKAGDCGNFVSKIHRHSILNIHIGVLISLFRLDYGGSDA
jgi:hypothetical protein